MENLKINKICITCNEIKNIEEYSKNSKNGFRTSCKECMRNNWKYKILSSISSRRHKSIRYDTLGVKITIKFLEQLKENQQGLCYWLKIPIDFTLKDKLRQPSIDRLDNTKGYELDNIVLTTLFANLGRQDSNQEDTLNFLNNYLFIKHNEK